jgi:hypothetical protein
MSEALKITIEEWANDNALPVTDDEINELLEAIGVCSEIDLGSRGFTLGHNAKSDKDKKIDELEKKIQTLELFILEKGISISYDVGYVTEHTMERITNTHAASNRKTTIFK